MRASLQIRDTDDELLQRMLHAGHDLLERIGKRCRVKTRIVAGAGAKSVGMDVRLVARLQSAADSTLDEGPWGTMLSGALHDASKVSSLMPTAMLFVSSIDGLSHCFEEDSKLEDLVASLRVLASARDGFGVR